MNIYAAVVIFVFSGSCLLYRPSFCEENTTIELAFVIYRHGERLFEHDEIYPSDNYTVEDFFPLTYGQITKEGKKRQYALGKKLRARYLNLIGDYYLSEAVTSWSTDWDRTKMSALLVLAGLFPPSLVDKWDDDLAWQPIPYHFKPFDIDYIIRRPNHYCPRYVKELDAILHTNEVKEILVNYENITRKIEVSTGKNMSDSNEVLRIYQNLRCKSSLNLPLPDWAEDVYPEPLQTMASYQCLFENLTPTLRRLNGGRMLQKFLEISRQKIDGSIKPPRRKLFLYSGHENDIVKILNVLGVYEQHVPPYGSAVILELHRKNDTNEFGFKIFYDNSTYTSDVHSMVMPGCDVFCEFNKFVALTEPLVPINYTEECESTVPLD